MSKQFKSVLQQLRTQKETFNAANYDGHRYRNVKGNLQNIYCQAEAKFQLNWTEVALLSLYYLLLHYYYTTTGIVPKKLQMG